ncbi:MAG: hypothetical protein IJU81_07540 [Bacteroidales bacterium]|nr:hypothetical protein [Bacteroidales bacterium]
MNHLKKIKTASLVGLYGSILVGTVVVVLRLVPHKRLYLYNNDIYQQLLIVGAVLAVVDLLIILFAMRHNIPRIRQMDATVDEKLAKYAGMVALTFYGTLAIVLIEGAIIMLCNLSVLIMILLLLVLMLFLSYPNMYKMKVDLGLTDDEMTSLFGESYVREQSQWDERPIACVELGKDAPEELDEDADDK